MNYIRVLNTVADLHKDCIIQKEGNDLIEVAVSKSTSWGGRAMTHLMGYVGMGEMVNPKKFDDGLLTIETAFMSALEDYLKEPSSTQKEATKDLALRSLKALSKMEETLVNQEDMNLADKVSELQTRIAHNWNAIERLKSENPRLQETLQKLESSVRGVTEGSNPEDAPNYLCKKIDLFLLTKLKLTPIQKDILGSLKNQLNELRNSQNIIGNKKIDINEYIDKKLLYLDNLEGLDQYTGVLLSGGFVYVDEINGKFLLMGHYAPMSIRKEKNMYIISLYNAGKGAIGKYKLREDGHLEGKTVVEFAPVTREKAREILIKGSKVYNDIIAEEKDAINAYKNAFKELTAVSLPLPDRDFQRIGNCGVRNIVEWMIYTLQRSKQEELANELVFFNIIQDDTTHPKAPILPLEDEGFVEL